ncbi:uncharacterized protein ARMOST_22490 [Armillaria ostoyae]|uniref:Uncharacterized protein n=1 Tax=Armillaria ostoyae TaxID=47428 RepID=A0A284SD06_ARMOS|nr:uncharacterized protein ARMOST_22490 [Armillaria ostoyae]
MPSFLASESAVLMFSLPDILTRFFTPGQIRSKCAFSPWEGTPITVPDPEFDFGALLKQRLDNELALEELDMFYPFDSQSPLTTPPSSPKTWPQSADRDDTPEFLCLPPLDNASPSDYASTMAQPSASRTPLSHSKHQSKNNRKRKCELANAHKSAFNYEVLPRVRLKHTHASDPIKTDFETQSAPHALTAYVGICEESWKQHHTLDELVGPKFGFTHCQWLGRKVVPVTDKEGRVIAIMAGHPDDPNWDSVHMEAAERLNILGKQCTFTKDQKMHCRGRFGALSIGISFGGGQMHPQNLHNNKTNSAILNSLLSCIAFIQLAGFALSSFVTWALTLFQYYALHFIFACATFNFEPWMLCYRHTDSGNLPFGWCAITALGKFDYCRGGHLVLWDLKLVIDFPPGSTILIPSTILRHSNTAIGKYEHCYSFTQYTPGGLFHWVDYGVRTSEAYWSSLDSHSTVDAERLKENRWRLGLDMFSTLEQLHAM